MTTLTKVIIGVILSFLLYSCNIIGIQGNGDVVTETRDLNSQFSAVSAGSGLEVLLIEGNQQEVIVEADSNLHEHILTYVKDNVLHIKTEDNIGRAESKLVRVTYTDLNTIITTSGANLRADGTVTSKNLRIVTTSGGNANLAINCKNLDATATSGGILNLSGTAVTATAKCTSGANLSAEDVRAESVVARATTGGNLNVYAGSSFDGSATTGGNVSYLGNPDNVAISKKSTGGNVSKG